MKNTNNETSLLSIVGMFQRLQLIKGGVLDTPDYSRFTYQKVFTDDEESGYLVEDT